jgi:hypothetical protein
MELLIVVSGTFFILLLPLFALIGVSNIGLSTILTSFLEPNTTQSIPQSGSSSTRISLEALLLAQKSRGYGKYLSNATIAYQQARQIIGADESDDGPSDCGEFVAVVVRSVYDPNYPLRGTIVQLRYDQTHPTRWTELPEDTPQALLEPGDIFVNDLHTYIYTGTQPNGYNSVAASWGGYIPEPSHLFYSEDGQPFHIFRASVQ